MVQRKHSLVVGFATLRAGLPVFPPSCDLLLSLCASMACLAAASCSPRDGGAGDGGYAPSAPAGPCSAVVQQHPIEGATHVDVCSVVDYGTKPPSSGNHYPVWAAYKAYTAPVPEGFFVHDLEHGAVVLTYNCAARGAAQDAQGGCDADIAAASKTIATLPDDPSCVALGQGVRRRSVLTPDPDLDVRFAASAWGWTLRANCFDPETFRAFELAHYAHGPEDTCQDGEDPVSQGLTANCGVE
jgi:hypothetical protein